MKETFLAFFSLLLLGSVLSCSGSVNILETFAKKDTDQAKYFQAKLLIDESKFDEAVTVLLTTSTEFQAESEYKTLLASAYAGKGGLTFLTLVENIKNASSTRLFPFLLSAFRSGTAANVTNLALAEDVIETISTDPALRTEDENTLMILVSFAKIGNYLSAYMDVADGDGNVDAGFADVCVNADSPGTSIDNTSVGEIGISLFKILNIIPQLSNNFIANVVGNFGNCTSVEDIGDPLDPLNPLDGMCSVTDPAGFTALQMFGLRSLLKESSSLGLGISCTGDITTCRCP